jgi:hypothetical protein
MIETGSAMDPDQQRNIHVALHPGHGRRGYPPPPNVLQDCTVPF